jgi:hypothetical protein
MAFCGLELAGEGAVLEGGELIFKQRQLLNCHEQAPTGNILSVYESLLLTSIGEGNLNSKNFALGDILH